MGGNQIGKDLHNEVIENIENMSLYKVLEKFSLEQCEYLERKVELR